MHFATEFWLSRLCFQRALGGIYLIAFLIAANQFIPLLGARGLQPVRLFVRHVPFRRAPSLFYINCSDQLHHCDDLVRRRFVVFRPHGLLGIVRTRRVDAHLGVALDHLPLTRECGPDVLRIRLGNNAGRNGFPRNFSRLIRHAAAGHRDVADRVGAFPHDVRCWHDQSARRPVLARSHLPFYHYETQPLPNPLSWYLHHAPRWFHKAGVLFNHFTELIVPWFYFMPAPLCYWAGAITIVFQITLILSGNLSWLNYITIVLCIPCFDDRFLSRLLSIPHSVPDHLSVPHTIAVGFVTAIVLALSWRPARNLFSRRQLMNASFEPLHLVNTYGAFGAVTRERLEVVIKGTDAEFADASAEWREYEFKGKPGDVNRPPCIVSPYHWKLDWQMWFAAMSPPDLHPWFLALVQRMLEDEKRILRLFAHNPFPDAPPKFIRADWYRYRFTNPGERGWWTRTFVAEYLPAVTLPRTPDAVRE